MTDGPILTRDDVARLLALYAPVSARMRALLAELRSMPIPPLAGEATLPRPVCRP